MGGTTEEIMIPLTSAASTSPMANRLRKRTPYSSTASTVLVLPTSTTRSIVTPRSRPHASGNDDAQPFVRTNAQKAAGIKPIGHAVIAAVFIHMDQLALGIRRA